MSGNYPPGVTGSEDYFNPPPEEPCEECGGIYAEGGHEPITVPVDGETVEEPCPNAGMTLQDLEKAREVEDAERRMDERRLQEAMKERDQ